MRDQRADPGGEQPGQQHERQPRAADRGRLDQDHRRDQRRVEHERKRGEAPSRGDHRQHLRRHLPSRQPNRQHRQTRTERQQRPLGAKHEPEAEPGEACEDHAGQIDRVREPARGETLGRHVPAVSRQTRDRQRDDQGADREDRERPPQRRALVISQRVRKMLEQLLLKLVNGLEVAPSRQRHDHPDHRRHDEQADVRPASHRLGGLRRRRFCGSGSLSHRRHGCLAGHCRVSEGPPSPIPGDGELAGQREASRFLRGSSRRGARHRHHARLAVSPDHYDKPLFKFTGTIERVSLRYARWKVRRCSRADRSCEALCGRSTAHRVDGSTCGAHQSCPPRGRAHR